jgi:hypothetical protein
MTSTAYSPVSIQTSSQAAPLPPPWFGQVVLIVAHLRKQGVLDAITRAPSALPAVVSGETSSSTLWPSFSARLSAANARWKPSTRQCCPGRNPSWRRSRARACQRARPSRAF